jgi:hypothetical protein
LRQISVSLAEHSFHWAKNEKKGGQLRRITLDGSLGSSGPIPTRANANFDTIYDIRQNLGQTRGSNLFHSFGRFNLGSRVKLHHSLIDEYLQFRARLPASF